MLLKLAQLIIFIGMFNSSCNTDSAGGKQSPADSTKSSSSKNTGDDITYKYDLGHPQKKWQLPEDLMEISGNTWIDKNHLLVIEDLHPNLYLLRLDDNTAAIEKKITFKEDKTDKKFDIEDVTIANNTVYALWSHGAIFKVTDWLGKPASQEIKTFLSKENNTEGICYDPVSHNLLIACKNESDVDDEKKSTRAIYEYDVSGDTLKEDPFMLIHKKDFKKETGEKLDFFPSAIAVHPVTHNIYILSTKDTKCMAVFTHDGKLISFEFIDKDLLLQPEGICFAPDGTLYISTEGKKGVPAYLCQYNFQK